MRERSLARLFFFGLAAFSFFVAGEEISWAQRLIAFQPPEVFLEHNYQQEANLHNLLKNILDTRWIVLFIALTYGVLWPLIALRLQGILQTLAPSSALIPAFLAVVLLEATYPFDLAGEIAELALGLALVAESIRRGFSMMWAPAIQAGTFAVAALIVPITDHLMYGDSAEASAKTELELQRIARELPNAVRPKLFKKRRVHKRIYTAVQARYFDFGKGSGWFLDAWNQPLWIESKRSGRQVRVRIYSFGPNRRRDADDLEVELELSRDVLTSKTSSANE
jgi:hypothetical protein